MARTVRPALWIGIPIVLVLLWIWISPYYSTILWWELRKMLFVLIPIAVFIVFVVLAVAHSDHRGSDGLAGGYVLLGIVFVLGTLAYWFAGHAYQQDAVYARSITVTGAPAPRLAQRAPFQVATAQARPNLGDTPGDIAVTAYIPQEEKFGTVVKARGPFSGYQTVLEQTIPLSGRGTGQRCEFDPAADARVSGWFGHNLGRLISEQSRWVRFSADDVYGYCDGTVPKVVVPLKEQDGTFAVTERPAGVAIYDGGTGQLSFLPDAGSVAGPSYPLSLASEQRESTHAMGSVWDYLFGRVGWDTTDDETDINSGSSSEFVLPTADKSRELYATPLTGRGSATSVSALSTVDAGSRGSDLARLTVYRLNPTWVSTGAIEQRIKADYQDIPNWQNLQVLELAPTSGGTWVATIGNDQNILYRVAGTGNLSGPSATCLFRGEGTRIRCGSVADQGGNGVGIQYGPGQVPAPGADLRTLSNDQLANLLTAAQNEAARRLRGGQ